MRLHPMPNIGLLLIVFWEKLIQNVRYEIHESMAKKETQGYL